MSGNVKPPYRLKGLSEIQKRFYKDKHRFIVVSAGRRARKSLIAKRKVFKDALSQPNTNWFHAAPTYGQAKRIFWNDLLDYSQMFRVDQNKTDLWVQLVNGSKIWVVGLDRPERMEGTPWHGGHITEYGNIKPGIWDGNIRPLFADTNGSCILDGVPEGRNHYYDRALYAAGGALPEILPLVGGYAEHPEDTDWCYYCWFSSDVLNEKEIESIKKDCDERTFRQEYQGSFENYEGLAYWNFGQYNIQPFDYLDGATIHIGMDFNVDPMTAALCHIDNGKVRQFDEIYLKNSNTYEMVNYIKDRYPVHKCVIYPDSTADSRSSNATRTDIEILTKAGFIVYAFASNPLQKNRINRTNSYFKTMTGDIRYEVDKRCVKTIRDFNRVEALPDGRLNKAQESQGLVHISDAIGYLIWYISENPQLSFPALPTPRGRQSAFIDKMVSTMPKREKRKRPSFGGKIGRM